MIIRHRIYLFRIILFVCVASPAYGVISRFYQEYSLVFLIFCVFSVFVFLCLYYVYGVFCSLNGEELYYKGRLYRSGEIINKDVFDNKIVIRFNNGVDFVAEKM